VDIVPGDGLLTSSSTAQKRVASLPLRSFARSTSI
jgi:hypothetical protein